MNGILFRERFPVLFLCLLMAFAGCQKKTHGPHHFIRLRADDHVSKPQFDTALMVLGQRLKETYDGDVTVRAEGKAIVLDVAGRPNLDSLAVLVLSKGRFGMYAMYNNSEVASPMPVTDVAPGDVVLIYAIGSDTASVRKQFVERNASLYNVLFAWGADDPYRQHLFPLYALKRSASGQPLISKKMINTATMSFDQLGKPSVSIRLKEEYATTWLNATRDNIGRHIAIKFANRVLSAPQVIAEIPGGKMEIGGNFTRQEARMLAAMIATPDLNVALEIEHIDTALFVPLRGYPTLSQQARYDVVYSELLRLRPQIDSLLAGPAQDQRAARQEMDRIYRQDINTITAETHATQPEVDEFIAKMETVLYSLKARLNGEVNEPDLKQMLETNPAQ